MLHFSNLKYKNPPSGWQNRNKCISELLEKDKTVLDLGCGYKNFLKFYNPKKYLGVDHFEEADIQLNLNDTLDLPRGWDYVINSGVLEYLDNIPEYISKISHLGNYFIFTWWQKPNTNRISYLELETILQSRYKILQKVIGPQTIYLCQPL